MGAKRRFPDSLIGLKFGRLLAVEQADRDKSGQRWLCSCECGTAKIIQRCALVSGVTLSCGCLNREKTAARGKLNATHGMSNTETYSIWAGMIARCNDLSDDRYGGRGISVCERWKKFENFLADMGERPAGLSIERDDVNGNYEPGNCRWATVLEQANNTRSSRVIEFEGVRQTLMQWARQTGIGWGTIRYRLENGWSIKQALTTKVKK
jgi:hypothetical protein